MRRNNSWVAILAIWTILPILRNGLAREQLPPNNRQGKLLANDGKAAYRAYETNPPTTNIENNDESSLTFQDELSKFTGNTRDESEIQDFPKINERLETGQGWDKDGTETSETISPKVTAKDTDANDENLFVEENPVKGSFGVHASNVPREKTELTSDFSLKDTRGRSNKCRGVKRRRVTERRYKESLVDGVTDSTSPEISGLGGLSSWIPRRAIKKFLRRRNSLIHSTVAYGEAKPRGRNGETASVKYSNQWGRHSESSTVDNADGIVNQPGEFVDIKEPYKHVERDSRRENSPSGFRETDQRRVSVESSFNRNSLGNLVDSPGEIRRPDRAGDRNGNRFGDKDNDEYENIESSTDSSSTADYTSVKGTLAHGDSQLDKLAAHGFANFNRNPVFPFPTSRWLDSYDPAARISTSDEKTEKVFDPAENPPSDSSETEYTSTEALAPRTNEITPHVDGKRFLNSNLRTPDDGSKDVTIATNPTNKRDESVYQLIKGKHRLSKRSSKSIEDNPTSPNDLKPFDHAANRQIERDTKIHIANFDDRFPGITNPGQASTSRGSTGVHVTEGIYSPSGGAGSIQRSRANTDKRTDNSQPNVLLPIPDETRTQPFSSSTTISYTAPVEPDFTEYTTPAGSQGNSVVSVPPLDPDTTRHRNVPAKKNDESSNSGVPAPNIVSYVANGGIFKDMVEGKRNDSVDNRDTLINDQLLNFRGDNKDGSIDEKISTKKIDDIENPLISTEKNYLNDYPIDVSTNDDVQQVHETDRIQVTNVEESTSINEIDETGKMIAGTARRSIKTGWNLTNLQHDVNRLVMEAEEGLNVGNGARVLSGNGVGNTSALFSESEMQSAFGEERQRLAKNLKTENNDETDAEREQLSTGKEIASGKCKIHLDPLANSVKTTSTSGQVENGRTIVDSVENETAEIDERIAFVPDARNESISLTGTSNVDGKERNNGAENYEEKTNAAKFSEKLNSSPTNVPIIAAESTTVILSPTTRNSMNQNNFYRFNADVNVDNEPFAQFTTENPQRKSADISTRGDSDEVSINITSNFHPDKGTRQDIVDPRYWLSKDPIKFSMKALSNENRRSGKDRKSRSSKGAQHQVPLNRSLVRYDSTTPSQDSQATDETTVTPNWSSCHGCDGDISVTSPKIDSRSQIPVDGIVGGATDRMEPDHPTEQPKSLPDRSTVTNKIEGMTNDGQESRSNRNTPGTRNSTADVVATKTKHVTRLPDETSVDVGADGTGSVNILAGNRTESPSGTVARNVSPRNMENSSHELDLLDQWPVKHSAVVEGDLVLGGLMMVHAREDTVTCGPVMPQGGVQALEAMLYTLDRLNEGGGIVPGVTIGAHILDDCDKDTYGLEMAVDFIKGTYILVPYDGSVINVVLDGIGDQIDNWTDTEASDRFTCLGIRRYRSSVKETQLNRGQSLSLV